MPPRLHIKKAYRKLARRHHPDPTTATPIRRRTVQSQITEAYEVLTDPARRHTYTPPATGHLAPPLTTPHRTARPSAPSSASWKTSGPPSAPGTAEVPPVVIIIAVRHRPQTARWGHHAPGRWHANHEQRAEIMISGEGLRRDARDVLGTLLHEAAHALAAARGIKDTSRQGRYHNTKYKVLAEELGITVTFDPAIGWSITTVPGHTAEDYASQLAALQDAMTLWRTNETARPPPSGATPT